MRGRKGLRILWGDAGLRCGSDAGISRIAASDRADGPLMRTIIRAAGPVAELMAAMVSLANMGCGKNTPGKPGR